MRPITCRVLTKKELEEVNRAPESKLKLAYPDPMDFSREYTSAELTVIFRNLAKATPEGDMRTAFKKVFALFKILEQKNPKSKHDMPHTMTCGKCGGCGCSATRKCRPCSVGTTGGCFIC